MYRVGLIIPSSNVVVEDTLRRQAAHMRAEVAFHIARFSVVDVNLGGASADQFQNTALDSAIDQLHEADVDQIVFAGTAGAWLGIDRERAWCARARDRTGIEITSTTLLTIEALRATAATRIGLISPFRTEVHDLIVQNFSAEGIPITCGRCLGLELSREMADVPPRTIADLVRSCLEEDCGAVLCFCTNFNGMDAIAQVSSAGRPATLFDSVGLTLQAVGGGVLSHC